MVLPKILVLTLPRTATQSVLKKLAKRGVLIEEQHEEWLEDNPLEERRPDLAGQAEAGCPEALRELAARCWADEPRDRLTFRACVEELRRIEELEELRPPRSLATSYFRDCYAALSGDDITLSTEVFAKVSQFIKKYCSVHGLTSPAQLECRDAFIARLQTETGGVIGPGAVLGAAGHTAELLWTSALTFRGMPP